MVSFYLIILTECGVFLCFVAKEVESYLKPVAHSKSQARRSPGLHKYMINLSPSLLVRIIITKEQSSVGRVNGEHMERER